MVIAMKANHETFMARALELASRGEGWVEPNPMVGAVVVREGRIVGEGWHERFGQAHAEVNALVRAGAAATGATLYVTLEPCCHHGKTPPCTDAILRAGIRQVVVGILDPFPKVAGQGIEILKKAGLDVVHLCLAPQVTQLLAPYRTLITQSRPWVTAKWAMTLDGKIATRTGNSQWISGEASRKVVHDLRGRMDAILVGINTALADNPRLTARPRGPRVAARVVLDRSGRLPLDHHLVATAREYPTMVVVSENSGADSRCKLHAAGCEVLVVPTDAGGRPSVSALLLEMGKRNWTNLLVEGGSEVLGSFFDAHAIDEVHVFLAPKMIGGRNSLGPVGADGVASIAEAIHLENLQAEVLDSDIHLRGRIRHANGIPTAASIARPRK